MVCHSVTNIPSDFEGLSVVEGLESSEVLRISFDEVCELVDELGALKAAHVLAPGCVEGLASSSDSNVDIFRRTCRDKGELCHQARLSDEGARRNRSSRRKRPTRFVPSTYVYGFLVGSGDIVKKHFVTGIPHWKTSDGDQLISGGRIVGDLPATTEARNSSVAGLTQLHTQRV